MIYVFPHCKNYETEILKIKNLSRLFAYPVVPESNNAPKILLNNGAYDSKMLSLDAMAKLSDHYKKYSSKNTFCIAPDSWMNPAQTMWNYRKWMQNGLFKDIVPVLQSDKKQILDIDNLKRQADFYRRYTNIMFLGNNGTYGKEARNLSKLFLYMKSTGVKWIHCLGAGWDLEDIKYWLDIKALDSIDSTAYYSTKSKDEFGGANPIENIHKIMELVNNCRK